MNKEMAMINGTEINVATVFDTDVTYTPSTEQVKQIKTEIKTLLDKYFPNVLDEGTGIEHMFNPGGDFWKAKGWLIQAFEKHPFYNGNLQIVLKDQDMCRRIDRKKILDFRYFVNTWFGDQVYYTDLNGVVISRDEVRILSNRLSEKIDDAIEMMYTYQGTEYNDLFRAYDKITDILYNQKKEIRRKHFRWDFEKKCFERIFEFFDRNESDCQFCDEELAIDVNYRYEAVQAIKKALRNGNTIESLKDSICVYDELCDIEFEGDLFTDVSQKVRNTIGQFLIEINNDDDLKELVKKEKQIAAPGQKISKIVMGLAKRCGMTEYVNIVDDSFYRADGVYVERQKDIGWNWQFAEFANAINPIILKATAVISVNPYDYYTMSFGKGWASCHTIDKENRRRNENNFSGMYCGGTESYMLDHCSIIFYYLPEDFEGDHPEYEDKVKRCVFYLGEDKLIQSRVYPDGRDGGDAGVAVDVRNIMQKLASELFEVPNLWKLEKGTDACCEVTTTEGVQYPDYEHYEDCNVSYLRRIDGYKNKKMLPIGRLPICPECGETHDRNGNIFCHECEEGNVCYCCGCRADREELHMIEGHLYCEDCCSYCEICGDWERNSYISWIGDSAICDYCRNNNYTYSDYDDEWIPNDEVVETEEGDYFRPDSDGYGYCDECGETHNIDDLTYDEETEKYYCEYCYAELLRSRENEE